ncbi:MAG: xanthine dehydrogenase family protein molybdopterin-binding subunit [Rhodospirillaceae bacterium]|nr:xanthine dehydrogenase family protein molybdopterin-binding subunit [Rhodospirillaceae bacterium]
MKFGVGQAVTRLEDQALITGGGRFTDDVSITGQAYAYVLRSPHAHARIVSIDIGEAKAAEGVIAVLTGADVERDGLGLMPCLIPMKSRDGTPRYDTARPILQKDRVRHVGDPVALVVAGTLNQARDAAELIEIEYEELPHAVDTYAAAQGGAALVWDHIPGNIAFDWEKGDRAGVEAALTSAKRVVKLRIVNNRVVVNSMEGRACVAEYEPAADRVTLYTSSQGVQGIRGQVADAILKMPKEKLRVVSGNVGGGFGMKVFVHPEQALLPWAAHKLKRTIRWTAERSEGFQSDLQGRDHVSFAELALDENGKFLGLKVETYANEGAYLSNYAPFVATGGSDMHVGLYTTPALYTRVVGVVTNTVPVDAYRGAGRPEAAYLLERIVDAAARETGLSPDEIRRRNFIPPQAMPYKTPLGDVFDSGEFTACMEKAMALADWAGFEARRKASVAKGKLRGRGMATYIERCGGGGPETAIAKFDPEKKKVTVLIGNQDNGQAHITSYTQLISSALDIDADHIEIVQGDSDKVPPGMTGGSRALPVGGAAMLGVSDKIKAKGKEVASRLLEAAVEDIDYKDGQFSIVGTDRRASLWDVAAAAQDAANLPEGAAPGLDEQFTRTPEAPTFPNGCHIIELEIDPDTGTVLIDRYTVVDDFGAVINPLTLAGQVHGGIVQGLGQALHEYTVYDPDSGQLTTASFMDYNLPKADAFPFFAFDTRNVRCTTNPLGVKGSGEAGAIGAPPAVINALVDALAPFGIRHIDMPATPRAIWEAIQAARPRAAAE